MTRPLLITHRPDALAVPGLPWSDAHLDLRHPLDVEGDPAAWHEPQVVVCDVRDLLLMTALHYPRTGTLFLIGDGDDDAALMASAHRLGLHNGSARADCDTSVRALFTILDLIHAGAAGPLLEALTRV